MKIEPHIRSVLSKAASKLATFEDDDEAVVLSMYLRQILDPKFGVDRADS